MARTAIITGGSKGIGWELVQLFAHSGYHVLSGSRTITEKIPSGIQENVRQVVIDTKVRDDHKKLVNTAISWTGRVDAYINNAGYSEWRALQDIDESFLKNIFETNLYGYFYGAQAAASIIESGGSILNISSIAGKRGSLNNSAYSATKFGVTALTQSLCKELGPQGIRVNAVCPVLIETPGLMSALNSKSSPAQGNSDKFLQNFSMGQTALGRLPTIKEVADLALFLCSESASGITGQSINIDCGVLPN
jgi:3-oxoacyl-[acyl-carrier protein] reductase/meso-butanediol dehydrogenase/(S,S)-butanediol dehydrogenase/diacetyl reductase